MTKSRNTFCRSSAKQLLQAYTVGLIFLLISLFACKKKSEPVDLSAEVENARKDSVRFESTFRGYEQVPAGLLKKDSFYLFEVHGSWGMYYNYAVIFPDTSGYSVWSESRIGCDFGCQNCTNSICKKNIDRQQWLALDGMVKRSGFLHSDIQHYGTCFDCEYYQLWIKQGKKSKVISWDTSEKIPDALRILATQILAYGTLPDFKPVAWVTEKGDSLQIEVQQYTDTFFVKSRNIEFNKQERPFSARGPELTVPKPDDWSSFPAGIYINQCWMDGTQEKKFITDFRKQPAKRQPWK